MIKINNNIQDLVLQVEEYTSVQKVFNMLTLHMNEVLVVCPELFFQRFVQYFDSIAVFDTGDSIKHIEDSLSLNKGYINLEVVYESKPFKFNFIITHTELKTINHPINGNEEYKVALNIIDIK